MEKREYALRVISSLCDSALDSRFGDYEYESAFRRLRADYPGYTFLDLMMICKIDRMLQKGQITYPLHDQLIDLYDLKVETDDKYWSLSGNESDDYYNSIVNKYEEINTVLSRYGLIVDSFEDVIDSTINKESYNDIDQKPMQKILKENGYI